jgi:hypothetical protein
MNKEAVNMYSCAMHPVVTSKTPGKGPKCNMDLVEKKKGHSDHD